MRISLGREITRLKLEVGFIFGHNEVIIHVPGYPRVPVFFDIKESDLNARFSSFLLVRTNSPRRPVIIICR